ncbi:MAG: FHA domain-containing protein [Deltaproteobacteria bacterium]|nr:FHA domain-containing protein [Deltaproteobacteria bacterium]
MIELDLTVVQGGNKGDTLSFRLDDGDSLSIGSAPGNDLVLADPLVAKYHAAVVINENERPCLIDFGSQSGTWLMGFRIEGKQEPITSGDEIRVGSTILRVEYDIRGASEALDASSISNPLLHKFKGLPLPVKALLIAALLLLVFVPSRSHTTRVSQSKGESALAQMKVFGFYPGKGGDLSHPQEVRFPLQPSDALVEFDFMSDIGVTLFVDELPLTRLSLAPDNWERWAAIVPDHIRGKRRELIFRAHNAVGVNVQPKRWGVRNVRVSQLSPASLKVFEKRSSDKLLREAAQDAEVVRSNSRLPFTLLRTLQRLVATMAVRLGRPGRAFEISLASAEELSGAQLRDLLLRNANGSVEEEIMIDVIEAIRALDAEMWRAYQNRKAAALLAAKAKNYHEALTHIAVWKRVLPDENDFRSRQLEAEVKKALPKRVLKNPEKYLATSR